MTHFIVHRLGKGIILFLFMTLVIFMVVRAIPVSPVDMLLQSMNLPLTEANRQLLIREYGLDHSLIEQYGLWLFHLLQGDFGISFVTHRPIQDEMSKGLPYSLFLGVGSLLLSLVIAFFMGYGASLHKNGFLDLFTRSLAVITVSFPSFIGALLLIYFLGVRYHWVSFFGQSHFWGLCFAFFLLTLYESASLTRMAKKAFDALQEETYVRFYVIRGFSLAYVLLRHCYKPALYSLLSASVARFSTVLGASVVLEFIFTIPGISYFLISSITARDYAVIQAYLVILFLWMFFVHFIIDILLRVLMKGRNPL